MEEITSALASPGWWFTAFLMALLVNLMAAYVKPRLDAVMGGISGKWRARNEASRERMELRVKALVNSSIERRIAWHIRASYRALSAQIMAVMALVVLSLAALVEPTAGVFPVKLVVFPSVAFLFSVLGLSYLLTSNEMRHALWEAERRLQKREQAGGDLPPLDEPPTE